MVKQAIYRTIKRIDKVEIRLYPALIIARVKGYDDNGFNILFNFINGNNQQKSKVKMTAPVISQHIEMTSPVISDRGSIAFVMPKKYALETTPIPLDERINIISIPSRIIAALKFTGRWSQSIFDKQSKLLLNEISKYDIKKKGNLFIMRYSGPFTPWFLRRNEVAVEVAENNI